MTDLRARIIAELQAIELSGGGNPVSRDLVRALTVEGGNVRFVLEAPSAADADAIAALEAVARERLGALEGVASVSIVSTTPSAPRAAPPELRLGGHPKPTSGPAPLAGISHVVAIGSGKGGVGKSTLSANLAVTLAAQGWRVGLLDADIHGPSQPRMMGVSGRPASADGKIIEPMTAYGVTMMSLGLMLKEGEAVIWRGPMLMGALQQMLDQVRWGSLDILLIDLPPGTGDVQLSLCQKVALDGALIVSTPQDVALIDARRAIDMFGRMNTPVLGLVENMATYICPQCGHEAHLFGHGGVAREAEALGVPLLGAIPLSLDIRLAGDEGRPAALTPGETADAYAALAEALALRVGLRAPS